MHFTVAATTDVGNVKETNQDSLCVKIADTSMGEVVMAIICDGMGGLSKGELASATVVREFCDWFDNELNNELKFIDMQVISGKWELMLKDLNTRILEYGKNISANIGTTFTGILFIASNYLIVHVGDTRAYFLDHDIEQLTVDHTVVAREIERGAITAEAARTDSRRNMLLQCVGASKIVTPQVIHGTTKKGVYLLCSDGFRHEISHQEIFDSLNPDQLTTKQVMNDQSKKLISLVKARHERDNISVALIKVE